MSTEIPPEQPPVLLLLFSDQKVAVGPAERSSLNKAWHACRRFFRRVFAIRSGTADTNRSSLELESSSLKVVNSLARRVLPEWEIISCSTRVSMENNLKELNLQGRKVAAAIADIWFREPDKSNTNEARAVLRSIKELWPESRRILVASLPEDPPHHEAVRDKESFHRFHSLSLYASNPWDELYNILKDVESRFLFKRLDNVDFEKADREYDAEKVTLPLLLSDNGSPAARNTKNVFWQNTTFTEPVVLKDVQADVQWHGCVFAGEVEIENCDLERLDIRDCVFEKPVLIRKCRANRAFRVLRCRFERQFNISRTWFNEDSAIEFNHFGHYLPWIERTFFIGRLNYQGNDPVGAAAAEALAGEAACDSTGATPDATAAPVQMFYRCRFQSRVYIMASVFHTKLAFYSSVFVEGRYTEISFPFLGENPAISEYRFRDPENGTYGTPSDVDVSRGDVELRFTNSIIAGRLVVRENPWRDDFYDRKCGLGIDFSGSTISGVVNLKAVRIRWLNLERTAVSGGEIFMIRAGLVDRESWAPFWPWKLAAEKCGIIFEERMREGRERAQFSAHFQHVGRLVEYRDERVRQRAQLLRIAQQYEDLRNAFSASPNTDWQEDYCHYKTMDYLRRGEFLDPEVNKGGRIAAQIVLLLALVTTVVRLTFDALPAHWYVIGWSVILLGSYLVLPPIRRVSFFLFDRWILRFVVAYGVYPQRPVVAAPIIIGLFALLFWVPSYVEWDQIGRVEAAQHNIAADDESDLIQFVYFSAVTFTTLGYGDFQPTHWLRWVAAIEALIGGIMIAVVTIALARQFLRR